MQPRATVKVHDVIPCSFGDLPSRQGQMPGQHSKVRSGLAANVPLSLSPETWLQPAAKAIGASPGRRIAVLCHPVTKYLLI